MLKSMRTRWPVLILALSLPAHAQYTQMIVDDQNRVMPIFFTDPNIVVQPHFTGSQQHYPDTASVIHQPSQIPVVTLPVPEITPPPEISKPAITKPAIRPKTDPMRGPYFISNARHQLMDAAHAAIGIPYKYGGNNPARGLDCSSLMQFIHSNAIGLKLPRTAAAQRDRSKTIRYQDLQPGDLLFFKIDAKTNHVGIYIGHGKFIHASASNRRAVIASMNLPYWQKRFVKFGSYLDT